MIIGIDFDNTIVCYDNVYKKIVSDAIFVPCDTPANKAGVKKYLIEQGKESKWTELQGEIYGPLMKYALPFPHVIEFIQKQQHLNRKILIISHRTTYPILGKKHDLHKCAKNWINSNLNTNGTPLLNTDNIFFNKTREEKIKKIQSSNCDFFIDDLDEILEEIECTPPKKILFSPDKKTKSNNVIASSWQEIMKIIND